MMERIGYALGLQRGPLIENQERAGFMLQGTFALIAAATTYAALGGSPSSRYCAAVFGAVDCLDSALFQWLNEHDNKNNSSHQNAYTLLGGFCLKSACRSTALTSAMCGLNGVRSIWAATAVALPLAAVLKDIHFASKHGDWL